MCNWRSAIHGRLRLWRFGCTVRVIDPVLSPVLSILWSVVRVLCCVQWSLMLQQVAVCPDSSRRECHQCGVTSFPHSMCRCRVCGLRDAHNPGCRQMQVLCAQCGSSTAPHNACRCCRCGKIHTIRAGCRPLSALNIRRLPLDCQRVVLISRVNCHQCGQFTAEHSRCRCRICGSCHSTTQACRNYGNGNCYERQ